MTFADLKIVFVTVWRSVNEKFKKVQKKSKESSKKATYVAISIFWIDNESLFPKLAEICQTQ